MISDPGRVNLRKAARAAIVVPVLFAIIEVGLDDAIVALFAAFASFAALVFCDFGGKMRGRVRAYTGVLVSGMVLVALGTWLSNATVAATAVMAVVGFGVVFLGSLGGYVAASGVTVVLAYVLAVMVPAPADQILGREVGWVVGVGVAAVAAVVLWPVQERRRVRLASATLADALATFLDTQSEDARGDARADVARARGELDAQTGAVFRPAGSATRDRALVSLVRELKLAHRFGSQLPDAVRADDAALYEACAATLRTIGTALRAPVATIDVGVLVRARAAHTAALEAWVRSSMPIGDGSAIVTHFDDEFPVRAMSLRVLAAAVDTAAHAGAALLGVDAADDHAPADLRFLTSPVAGATTLRKLADHFTPSSVRFRAALRAAIGLAIAVAIAKAFDLDHAFWVVLGTLSVLRSNALGTGVTAVQAVLGTTIGFGVASLVIVVVGGDHNALWVVLPIAVFASAYTPGAIHFVVGQASFTVFVVVLFNLLEPEGWKAGLVRVEDIALGVGISLVVGVLLWPRGARAAASACFAVMLTDGARLVARALEQLVGDQRDADHVSSARIQAVASRDRAISALEDLTVERGGGQVDRERWIALLTVSGSLLLAGDGIARLAADGRFEGCAEARAELEQSGHEVDTAVRQVADRLGSPTDHDEQPSALTFAPPATNGLCACVRERAAASVDPPIALLWTREFLTVVQQRLASLPA